MLPGERRGDDALVLELGPASDRGQRAAERRPPRPAARPATTVPRWAAARRVLGRQRARCRRPRHAAGRAGATGAVVGRLYPALQGVPDRDALAALPVPLADGRTVTGPRGVLLPGPELDAAALAGLPLRLADPARLQRVRRVSCCAGSAPSTPTPRPCSPIPRSPTTTCRTPRPSPWWRRWPVVCGRSGGSRRTPAAAGRRRRAVAGRRAAAARWAAGGRDPSGCAVRRAGGRCRGRRTNRPCSTAAGVLRHLQRSCAREDVLLDPDDPVLLELDGSDQWIAELAGRAAVR